MTVRTLAFLALIMAWHRSEAGTLAESEFLASALATGQPAVEALQGPVATAAGEERTSRVLANPWFDFEREAPGEVAQSTLTLGWTPPLDGRRGPGIAASGARFEAAQKTLDWNLLQLRAELREVYASWAVAVRRSTLIESHVATMRAMVDKALERKRVGEESGLTAERLSLALVELEASAAHGAADAAHARAIALGRIGAGHEDSEPGLPALPDPPAQLDVAAHPLLAARRAEVTEAEAQARLASRFLSAPELRAGWLQIQGPNEEIDGLVLGFGWHVPLFDRRQGEGHEWNGRLRASRARLDTDHRQAEAMLRGAHDRYRTLRAAAVETAAGVDGSERIVARATARFQLGESTVTDLLDTLDSVLSSRLTELELYAAALEAHRLLELASGRALSEPDRGGE